MIMAFKKDYVAVAIAYAEKVVSRKQGLEFGIFERLACKRFLDDLERQYDGDCTFEFHNWFADDVCDFIEKMPHIKSKWETPNITLHETQIFIVVNLFGFRQKADLLCRRFSNVYIEMARKNAKSTLVACIALYCMFCEGEDGAEILTAATTTKQAKIVLDVMRKMVLKCKPFRQKYGIKVTRNELEGLNNNSDAKAISAEGETNDGWNPHCAVVDELHAHKKADVYNVIASAFGARSNPLLIAITTAGNNLLGVCYGQRSLDTKILDGTFKNYDHYFGVIYTLDEGDDVFDPENWRKANPLYKVSVKEKYLHDRAKNARASASLQADFETKNLNIWQGSSATWLNMLAYHKCANPEMLEKLEKHTEIGGVVEIGVDLSEKMI